MSDAALFEVTFDTIPDGVIVTLARDGSVIYTNRGFQTLTGYDRRETVGRTTADLALWLKGEERQRLLSELSRSTTIDDFITHFRRKDGAAVSVMVCASSFAHDNQRYLVGICKNIDRWRNLNRDLDDSRARYMNLVELLPAVLFECDDELRFSFLNAAGLRTFGEAALGAASGDGTPERIGRFLRPIHDIELESWIREAPNLGSQSKIEVEVESIDGRRYQGLLTMSSIQRDEAPRGYLGILVDTTRERLAKTELSKLTQAVEQSPSIVVITDKAGHIEYVNQSFTRLTGFLPEETIGRTPRILKSGTVPEETYRTMWNTILQGREWKTEILNRKKNGETYWQRSRISPIYDDDGKLTHFLEVAEDITREKELEGALFQSQKMEAIGHLAGGIAHDFNNMLTVIIGVGELLQGELEPTGDLHSYTESILSAARRSASLTHQLLAFSRKQLLNPEELNLNSVIRDAEKLLRRVVGDNIKIETKLCSRPATVLLDQSQLNQIILNLVINAREAISGSGTVRVSTDCIECNEERLVASGTLSPGAYATLSVSDTGCGIDADTMSHIFEPFYTTKSSGTGLGLSTVYGIVRQSKGHIEVRTGEGSGTTFTLYFHLVERAAERPAGTTRDFPANGGSETILVVEDDDAVRTFVARVLTSHGYTVILADSAERAEEIWGDVSEAIDLLLTDVVLPEDDGVRLYGVLRKLRPDLPVVYMSGYTDDSSSILLELADGKRLLPKPFGAEQLKTAVRHVLDELKGK